MFRDILFVIVLFTSAKFAVGGECCASYIDRNGTWHHEQDCSTYCCDDYKSDWFYTSLRCCSSLNKQAHSFYRISSCGWWHNNRSWFIALIVIAIGGCIAFYVLCANGYSVQNCRTEEVMMQAQQQDSVVMIYQNSQMSQNQGVRYPPSGSYGNQAPSYHSVGYGNEPPPSVVMMNQMSQMSQNQCTQYPPSGSYGNQPPPYRSGGYSNEPPPPFDGNQWVPPQKY